MLVVITFVDMTCVILCEPDRVPTSLPKIHCCLTAVWDSALFSWDCLTSPFPLLSSPVVPPGMSDPTLV